MYLENSKKYLAISVLATYLSLESVFCFGHGKVGHTKTNLEKLFFDLQVDTCQSELIKEITLNKNYRFKLLGEDNPSTNEALEIQIEKKASISFADLYPCYKLVNKKNGIVDCDSTLVLFQPVSKFIGGSNSTLTELKGHEISILLYFTDSITASKSYLKLCNRLIKILNKPSFSGDFTIDGKVAGNTTTISIDKGSDNYDYEKILSISLHFYQKLFEIKIEYALTMIRPEDCI
jgi:hypothetical protein